MGTFIDFLREHGLEASVVRRITISDWGRSIAIDCTHNPYGDPSRDYGLLFRQCSRVSWAVPEPMDGAEAELDIIGFETQAQHRGIKPHQEGENVAVLATTDCELIISYASFTLEMA
jgi:hypothetical protein